MEYTNIIDELKKLEDLEKENAELKKKIEKEIKRRKELSMSIKTFKENPEYYELDFLYKKKKFDYFEKEFTKIILIAGSITILLMIIGYFLSFI